MNQIHGNVLLFYAFDMGDEIDLERIREKELLPIRNVTISPYFKDYHIPLSFNMPGIEQERDCIMSKLHHFGVLSFCYRVPYSTSLSDLSHHILSLHDLYLKKSEADARIVFDIVARHTRNARFYHLKHSYYAVQVHPLAAVSADEFKAEYGNQIVTLLRRETQNIWLNTNVMPFLNLQLVFWPRFYCDRS